MTERVATPFSRWALAVVFLCVAGCRTSASGGETHHAAEAARDDARTAAEVEGICHAQQAAWNRGDIDGFMRVGYWASEDLTFFSGGDVTRGYETVLARYRKRYKSDGAEMGQLEFSDLETRTLGPDHALVRGRWHLDFESRDDVGGLFSLIVRRTADGWRIVHDHTSVAD